MKYLLGQYADDMDAYMKPKQSCVKALFDVLDRFRTMTGCTVNYDKTSVYRVGSLRNTQAKCYTERKLFWTNDSINILGVWVGPANTQKCNYEELISKANNILDTLKRRNLSLLGKISIINTLVSSLFNYKLMVLPDMDNEYHKIEHMFLDFIWAGKKAKISLDTLQTTTNCGGAKLVSLRIREAALKISWIKIIHQDYEIANLAYNALSPVLSEIIWKCNLKADDVKKIFPDASFWLQVLKHWCKYNYEEVVTDPGNQIIWFNSQVLIEGKPFIMERPARAGLITINQLIEGSQFVSWRRAYDLYSLTILQYNGIVSALPTHWKAKLKSPSNSASPSDLKYKVTGIIENSVPVKQVYAALAEDNLLMVNKHRKWERDVKVEIPYVSFLEMFEDIKAVTSITKYRSFQFRLLQRALVTNIDLHRWNLRSDSLYTFCHKSEETILHLFIWCEKVANLWVQIEKFMESFSDEQIHFSVETVLWNRFIASPKGHIKNFICLLVKQYIYRNKCLAKALSVRECVALIRQTENHEKYYTTKNDCLHKFIRKWYPKKTKDDRNDQLNDYVQQYAKVYQYDNFKMKQ